MKRIFTLAFLFLSIICLAQKEGQSFCDGDSGGEYFPLTIEKKKIFWFGTYYFETQEGSEIINGKSYLRYKQLWKDGDVDVSYFRNDNGAVMQYKENGEDGTEVIRYQDIFPEGKSWTEKPGKVTYTILSYNAKLLTPYCLYKNLMALKAEYEKVTYVFYYQKGYGYVGATKDEKLISYVTPEF